jgi:hypothetical protein
LVPFFFVQESSAVPRGSSTQGEVEQTLIYLDREEEAHLSSKVPAKGFDGLSHFERGFV